MTPQAIAAAVALQRQIAATGSQFDPVVPLAYQMRARLMPPCLECGKPLPVAGLKGAKTSRKRRFCTEAHYKRYTRRRA